MSVGSLGRAPTPATPNPTPRWWPGEVGGVRSAVVIQQQEGSAGHAHQHGGREGSGAGSASEQQESSGFEHWVIS